MLKRTKSKAEELFAATQKNDKQALKEKEKARQESAEQMASLRALRLAKEASDKEAAKNKKVSSKHSVKSDADIHMMAKND